MHKTYLNGLPASAFTKYVFQKNALDRLIRSGLWGDTVVQKKKILSPEIGEIWW